MQLKKLGSSLAWSRTRFTMDEASSRAVQRAFVELHQRGKVYLGKRLVNWCPRCATALSDIEVEYVEQAGHLWHIRYPVEGGGEVVVATTRPETLLGDTAVAVHPEDERYTAFHGKRLRLPLREKHANALIPLVTDAAVDKSFGSGAVKVTPAHDAVDYEIGQRHHLPSIMVIGYDGKMTPLAGDFTGLAVKDARAKVVESLEAAGLLVKTEPYKNNLATCYRCAHGIEPLESSQWFVKTGDMARRAAEATESGKVRIHPESWAKPYLAWLKNNKDWCISRQIWWGHQIPIWYCRPCVTKTLSTDDRERLAADRDFGSQRTKEILRGAAELAVVSEGAPGDCRCGARDWIQDPDVLDTWFSSGLWPLSTLGWPEDTPDLNYFYPTSVLATGHEILYLWVARMVMMGLEFRGDVPYRDVFIHGIVRDKQGRKMSKSLNNVIDPLDVMKKFGTDALRFALVSLATPGRDMQMSDDSFVGARNFANKLWNASRFALGHLEGYRRKNIPLDQRELADRWIRRRLEETLAASNRFMEDFDLAQSARALYDFFRSEFCDWYIELAKIRLLDEHTPAAAKDAARETLTEVLDAVLRALHPVMPFITEELWQALGAATGRDGEAFLMTSPLEAPRAAGAVTDGEMRAMALLMEATSALRTIRSEMNVPPGKTIAVTADVAGAAPAGRDALARHAGYLRHLAKIQDWRVTDGEARPKNAATAVVSDFELRVPLEGLIDFEVERKRLEKKLAEKITEETMANAKLADPNFAARAPADKVAEVQARLAECWIQKARLQSLIASLG
jgi:valyl-tRNA synthetase